MERLEKYQELEFIREWLQRLCLKGITLINLGHNPGLRGMMAVTDCLEKKTYGVPESDGVWQIFRAFFLPSSGQPRKCGKLELFLVQSSNTIDLHVDHSKGATFDFSVYVQGKFPHCKLAGVSELAEELAEVFAKAYNGNSPDK